MMDTPSKPEGIATARVRFVSSRIEGNRHVRKVSNIPAASDLLLFHSRYFTGLDVLLQYADVKE
jgi:hypothetical protein